MYVVNSIFILHNSKFVLSDQWYTPDLKMTILQIVTYFKTNKKSEWVTDFGT